MAESLGRDVTCPPPHHVAIIMDGNNRWAREHGLSGVAGHRTGVENVRNIVDACSHHGIKTLTLFAFSSENWQRPKSEVRGLITLFATYIRNETRELQKKKVRLRVIGERSRFSKGLRKRIEQAEALTAGGEMDLILAVDYGGRWDITEAARALAEKVASGVLEPGNITEEMFAGELSLADIPAPDLCIRTAGEQRISNFLLWQMAYTEFYFADCYWPDFGEEAFAAAMEDYKGRKRRFGLSSSQLQLSQRESA